MTSRNKRKQAVKRKIQEVADDVLSEDDLDASDVDASGNIADLICDSEEESQLVEEDNMTQEQEAEQLLKEFPFERSLLTETSSTGPRRSKRCKKTPTRYFETYCVDTFLNAGGKLTEEDIKDVFESSDEEGGSDGDDDEDYNTEEGEDKEVVNVGYAVGC